ncbi:MAG: molybdenum cofactor guanylyltransferase [Vicinamibacterales bacterium]
MWSAAILAGGQARRLGGRDKGQLVIGGQSILARHLDCLRSLEVEHIVIVGRYDADDLPPVPVVSDAVDHAGALGGVYTALLTAPRHHVIVLASDMPFISASFLRYLTVQADGVDAAVPRTAIGRHPLCAVYDRRVAPTLKERLDRGALRVVDALDGLHVRDIDPSDVSRFDPDGVLLTNINTPDDYARARRYADARDNDRGRS